MNYLIESQKKKKIEEILFEINNSDVQGANSDQVKFMKGELRIQKVYKFIGLFLVVGQAICYYLTFFHENWIYEAIIVGISLALMIFGLAVFTVLFRNMKKFHNFEFKRIYGHLVLMGFYTILGSLHL